MKQPRRDVSQDISASNNISNTANAAGSWRFPACRRHRITTTAARSTPVRYGRRRALTDLEGRPRNTLIATLSDRSEEHTSELQSLMRISYAVFCLKKKTTQHKTNKKSS